MKITYIAHSGFSVETESALLVFDYYRGALPTCPDGKKLIFFVSHHHDDHYSKRIFERDGENTYFILDSTVRTAPDIPNICYVSPNKTYSFDGMTVKTLRSTDCGVAFLVKTDGHTVYHAGDLHLWLWNGASTYQSALVRHAFESEIEKLKDEQIDLAFLPVDPRQEQNGTLGADHVLRNLNIKHAFPMHFWGDPDYVRRFAASLEAEAYREKLVLLLDEGKSTEFDD